LGFLSPLTNTSWLLEPALRRLLGLNFVTGERARPSCLLIYYLFIVSSNAFLSVFLKLGFAFSIFVTIAGPGCVGMSTKSLFVRKHVKPRGLKKFLIFCTRFSKICSWPAIVVVTGGSSSHISCLVACLRVERASLRYRWSNSIRTKSKA